MTFVSALRVIFIIADESFARKSEKKKKITLKNEKKTSVRKKYLEKIKNKEKSTLKKIIK